MWALYTEEYDSYDIGTHSVFVELFEDREAAEWVASVMKELGSQSTWRKGPDYHDWWVVSDPIPLRSVNRKQCRCIGISHDENCSEWELPL